MNFDRRLLDQIGYSRRMLAVAVFFSLAGGGLVILQAGLLSRIVSGVFLSGQDLGAVLPWMVQLLAVIMARGGAAFIADGSASAAAVRIKTGLREKLLKHVVELGPAFTSQNRTGDLVVSALQGIEAIDPYFSQYLTQLILAAVLPIAILGVIFPLDLLTGIIFLVTAPLVPLFMILIGSTAETLTRRQFNALRRLSAYFLDTLQGLKTLKALNQSQGQSGKIRDAAERYRHSTLEVLRLTFLSALALELLTTISTAIVAVEIGLRLLAGQLLFEQAFFILLIAPEFYLPLRMLGQRYHAAAAGVSAARKIFEVLDCQPELPAAERPKPGISYPASLKPVEISLEKVRYRYPEGGQDSLDDVSFTIRSGELVALVGPSGAGKSTLASLLLRFIEPQAGQLTLNGIPARRFTPATWRQLFAWVPQNPSIFAGTLVENIRLGNPKADLYSILQAARQAGLEKFAADLPQRYETRISEGGARLSGGQAQRLALARAFLREAPLLLLDEPGSHLDAELDAELETTVRQLCQKRAALVIAHRQSTILRADRILVLEQGRLVEIGTHAELIARNGTYARLFNQARWAE